MFSWRFFNFYFGEGRQKDAQSRHEQAVFGSCEAEIDFRWPMYETLENSTEFQCDIIFCARMDDDDGFDTFILVHSI